MYEADGRLFRETLAPLNAISVTAAAVVVPLQIAALLAALATAGIQKQPARPTRGRCLAGIGKLWKGVEDYVAFGHAGHPESGLNEQAPCPPAPHFGASTSQGLAGADI